MSDVLNTAQRNALDKAVQTARQVAEAAAAEELGRLGVAVRDKPSYLSDDDAALRRGLRAKARQLGDELDAADADLRLLRADVAYEQWHRLLFARFLAENGLLRHPDFDEPVTLKECEELAAHEGEPDGWMLAARYASRILPGVFRLTDPAVQVRYSPERRAELERIVEDLDADVFRTEDALGWVYQFWQTAEEERVRRDFDKFGAEQLPPTTQKFTENYMVRFLLENSLGAWWAARHPDSPLVDGWEYLRRLDDGTPAAGTFSEWPTTAAEVTVMDPCCGSGHFLVAAFGMLWRMRAEEEGLTPVDAQDAVLRENIFGLELDPRCTQIAAFNVILEAWKQGGFRTLATPSIACSGIRATVSLDTWFDGVSDDPALRATMTRLRSLFGQADVLGSLIDPRLGAREDALLSRTGDLRSDDWPRTRALLQSALAGESGTDSVAGGAVLDVAAAADLLGRVYTLVATNPPYLKRSSMDSTLQDYIDVHHPMARADIATAFIERALALAEGGTVAVVSPQNWLLLTSYEDFRGALLDRTQFDAVARLGSGAFRQITGEVVKVALTILSSRIPNEGHVVAGLMAQRAVGPEGKARELRLGELAMTRQEAQRANPDSRITLTVIERGSLLKAHAVGLQGIATADYPSFGRFLWERPLPHPEWAFQQSTVSPTIAHGGREHVVWWERGAGVLAGSPQARIQGLAARNRRGVAVSQMGDLPVTLYTGELFDNNTAVILPNDEADLPAIWAYCSSDEFAEDVRELDDKLNVTNATLVKVPFDIDRWRQVAEELGPLPAPFSSDPTQWIFSGVVSGSDEPLQVAVARLLGYRWPDQVADDVDELSDADGIVALPSLGGELDAATRLRDVLARAYGSEWSSGLEQRLVREAGGKSGVLGEWLRDGFFAHHCKVFQQRPFLWQVWDGRKDGFSAIVNYHRLDHATLSKLTFSTLGAWIERQKNEVAEERPGAAERLGAALDLQRRLGLILDGEAPYDVYVRWKDMHEQPIGWHPGLDDGVRLNIRPFVEAGVLRSKVNVHWRKDRGKNPDGSERINDLHPSLEERRAARRAAGVPL